MKEETNSKYSMIWYVYEVFERMAYYGISSNLVLYLTEKLHQGTVASANNVTNWVGTIWVTPIIGAYIADAHLGRYWTFVIASVIYISGMCLLTLSVSLPSLKPPACGANTIDPTCTQKASPSQLGIFFLSLYILAIGTGGTKPNISTIGADQFDVFDPKERFQKLSFFNWWMFSIFFGTLFANTVLVYIQDNVGWTLGYALPSDPKELHELELIDYKKRKQFMMESTTTLRFLNKAAVKNQGLVTPWTLCTVTQVEETKTMLKMLPILLVTFVPSIMVAQINTLFVKQGTTLNRHIGPHFQIPAASLQGFVTFSMLVSVVLYDRIFVPITRKITKNPRGITLLQRMGIGLIIHILIMAIASLTEHHRLNVAREHGVAQSGGKVPLTIFILLPQFVLMGFADAFLEVAKLEFFYDQAPEGMKSLGTSYAMTTLGVGNFLSSILLSTVSDLTKRNGHMGWITNNLNESHLDYYYAFFVGLNCINFIAFFIVSRLYVYKAEIDFHDESSSQELVSVEDRL
ncbi:protein NRT1/ PTR FAMILY 5.2-like protein [Carex littledalei]|uniref:Protein NRT1/ PTR FAMILY 5.2-like protein n=1 Tax=Carex littledalei TaxID=544730 RepID=A0A833QVW8_9POAL|nr:protein NRT1/ PTR FAMILY 5.2-like protein [Carex littledalei]